jgi:hypothetical protein
MTHRRESHHQTLDPFAALGICEVRRVERVVRDHLAAQACPGEPRRRVATTMHQAWTWLRHRRLPDGRIPRRRPA